MPKIEIELDELQQLQKQKELLENENSTLKKKVNDLDEDVLVNKSIDLAERLFNDYVRTVFEKLGMNDGNEGGVQMYRVRHELGDLWHKRKDRIKIELSAHVLKEWKQAYLSIGVISREKAKQTEKLILDQ
jgi:hypothetical protein